MDDTSNRTFVCSVLFLDIVEYSKKSVSEQLKLKQRFNALLIHALQQVAASDRIVLDTGDGAAVCFLGSPEVAMFVAMDLRDGIAGESPNETPPLLVRMGANLGPIRLIKDINGQINIIGDGVNVAQRVMSFADENTVLVSRSFYEVVSRLSDDYAQILHYEGSRTDKHVREHEVYAVGPSIPHKYADQAPAARAPVVLERAADPALAERAKPAAAAAVAGPGINKKLLAGVSLLAAAIIGGGVLLRLGRGGSVPASPPTTAPAEVAPPVPAKAPAAQSAVAERPAKHAVAEAAKPAAPAKATLTLTILPWGEVYVDGQKRGVSPPLKSIALAPGSHTVEIRNAGFPAHAEKIEAKPGAQLKIKHKF
ncbi:MAG TPA: adenylate/guanylate cyclase domain-containing protein [Rhodocyclaceae bacterium]